MSLDVCRAVWAALTAAFLGAEVFALVGENRFPTLGDVLDLLVHPRVGRWLVLVGWLWLGWHILVRYGTG